MKSVFWGLVLVLLALLDVRGFTQPLVKSKQQQRQVPFLKHLHRRESLSALNAQEEPTPATQDDVNSSALQLGIQDKNRHVSILNNSLEKLTGKGVYERMGIDTDKSADAIVGDVLVNERFVLISHGTQDDPIYNFGNTACLQVFVRSWEELCKTPSRESVVIRSQDETLRQELMAKVTTDGYVEGATGIRVTGDGGLIRFDDAVVWNLYDEDGDYYGQAAFFDREKVEPVDTQI